MTRKRIDAQQRKTSEKTTPDCFLQCERLCNQFHEEFIVEEKKTDLKMERE